MMEYPWRPRPPSGNFCPVCSNSHFPFCPPPPPQYFRPPPPPPDQFFLPRQPPPPQPSYDPFVDHQAGPPVNPYPPPPPPPQISPRPWSGNPNFSNNCYGNSYQEYDQNVQVGAKRMRFDNVNEGYTRSASEDERRLKLIRDHGAATHGLNQSFEASNFNEKKGNFGDRSAANPQIRANFGDQQFAHQHTENNTKLEFGRSAYNQSESNAVQNHMYVNNYNQPGGNPEALKYDNVAFHEQRRDFSVGSRENQVLQSNAPQQLVMEPKLGYYGLPNHGDNLHPVQVSPGFKAQPPLPLNPPPLIPAEPPRFRFPEPVAPTSATVPGSLFPISVDSASSFQPSYAMVSDGITSVSSPYPSQATPNSNSYYSEEIQSMKIASSKTLKGNLPLDKPKIIDGSHILKHPYRANRPDHIVIILRGLPGSGKSYLAKIVRDLEVENGGTAPRIHSMDEYFMTEVEKVEESEGSKSSGSIRGKKPTIKKVMEYCYEPEMEEAYRSSMLKAFKKTLDEGTFPFVIVDDRNLRVADFAQFWATAKRSGYEVYLLEATYKDPAGCAARNVHGFTQNDIQDMANQWEEAPSMYMKLDIKSLLHGDDLEENGIQEVDMDMDDGNCIADPSGSEDGNNKKVVRPSEGDNVSNDQLKDEQNQDALESHPVEEVKELGKSKWSNDLDDDDTHKTEGMVENSSALSNLMQSYGKKGKSVRWADKVGSSIGFSIGSGKSAIVSLIIGPGSGYNSKTNPPPDDEKLTRRSREPRKQNIFQEQLRAEGEAFKAVFDKRRHRIGGLDVDDE